jgi:hypothetical protein
MSACVRHNATLLLSCLVFALLTGAVRADDGQDLQLSATLAGLVEESSRKFFARELGDDQPITWTVHVPAGYDPERPPGLFVFVPPIAVGTIPGRLKLVMAEKNLVWVAANQSGNKIDPGLRFSYALLAPLMAGDHFRIDQSRIYISGFSGGGRVASAIAPQYPGLFKGAIYICGVNSWGDDKPRSIKQVRNNRYVFLTGTEDFNRSQTRDIYREYKQSAVKGIQFMDVKGMAHAIPPAKELAVAIDFLDGKSPEAEE